MNMMPKAITCAVIVAALSAVAEDKTPPKDVTITFDINMPTYIDRSKSKSFPDLGYAGCIADEGPEFIDEFFRRTPDRTWEVFKGAGARVVKIWDADGKWERDKARWFDVFSWFKKHDVKVLLCIEHYKGWAVNDARRRILGFVRWIVDNGFTTQVAGFELGNEPYWGAAPEIFADRWAAIVPDMKKIWSEAQIGIAIAELVSGDPDIDVVRSRCLNVDALLSQDAALGMDKINNWSGRFIKAFSDHLHLCSHVVYHFYGGFGPCGCTYNGIRRIRRFAKAFPEVKDKKVWITEWRFTSDTDLTSHQSFKIALFDALYMLMIVCQPEVEGISAHQCGQISGGFYIANGNGTWRGQYTHVTRRDDQFTDPDWTGRPRLEVGPTGPVFKLWNEALMGHPHVLARGRRKGGSIDDDSYWSPGGIWKGGEGIVEWVLLANADRTSAALMVCNCCSEPFKPPLKTIGCTLGKPHYRVYSCKKEDVDLRQMPGEPRIAWQDEYDGREGEIVIPPKTIATVVLPVRKGAK